MYNEIDCNILKDKIGKLCDDNKIEISIDYQNMDISYETLNKILQYLNTSIKVFKNRNLYKMYIDVEKIYAYIGEILGKTNQEELANRLNVSQSFISKMVNHYDNRFIRTPTFNRICERLSLNKYDYIKESLRESIQLNMDIKIKSIEQDFTKNIEEYSVQCKNYINRDI